MEIIVIAVGTIRGQALSAAVNEYKKRLSAYSSVSVRELPEVPYRESFSESEKERVKQREGEYILRSLGKSSYVVALDPRGRELTSLEFAHHIQNLMVAGKSSVAFVIGGSLGLSQSVLERSDLRLSLSRMTFTHQIARLVLFEQLYRAFKIIRGETYHK